MDDNLYYSLSLDSFFRFVESKESRHIFCLLTERENQGFGEFSENKKFLIGFSMTELLEDMAVLVQEKDFYKAIALEKLVPRPKPTFFFFEQEACS